MRYRADGDLFGRGGGSEGHGGQSKKAGEETHIDCWVGWRKEGSKVVELGRERERSVCKRERERVDVVWFECEASDVGIPEL